MTVFCFDSSEETAKILKKSLNSIGCGESSFYFNKNPAEIINCSAKSETAAFIDTRFQIKKHNGFSLAEYIRKILPDCHIVFTSPSPADMAFCFKNLIRPSGFLLKPLTNAEINAVLSSIAELERKNTSEEIFHVSTHEYKRSIKVNKIVYFSTLGKKLFLKTSDGEKIEFYGTLSELEKNYNNDFIRCHSGFLVNKLFIKGIKKGELELSICSESIPISKKYKSQLFEYLL